MLRQTVSLSLLLTTTTATATEPSFVGHEPLFRWASWAPEALESLVCFEGIAVPGSGTWSLSAVAGDSPRAAVARLAATGYPARFSVVERSGRQVIVPAAVKAEDGSWSSVTPLFDTRVDLEPQRRSTDDALTALLDALERRTGERVLPSGVLNGEAVTDAGGVDVPARDLLVRILDDHLGPDRAHNGVWRLVWYDTGQHWFLNVGFVSALEHDLVPPPGRDWPASPPTPGRQ